MIYTDDENKRWWSGLTKLDQGELIEKIIEKAFNSGVKSWAESVMNIWERGGDLDSKTLASLRKWDR